MKVKYHSHASPIGLFSFFLDQSGNPVTMGNEPAGEVRMKLG